MEFSEQSIQTFEKEGFLNVYEWKDDPGTVYSSHTHEGKVSMIITEGSIEITIGGETIEYKTGDRIDVPPHTEHSAVVGPAGWQVVVGEEIAGDS